LPSTQYICFFYVVLPIFASSSSSSRLLCCCCLQFQFQRFDSLIVCAKVGASGQDHQSMILICCSLLLVWTRAFFFTLALKSQRRPSLAKHIGNRFCMYMYVYGTVENLKTILFSQGAPIWLRIYLQ